MINDKRLLAIVPARSGSKRLPNKNTLNLAGKPLIAWSIEAGLQSKYVDRVVVSTNCASIANISKDYGADVPFMRPDELSTDMATTIDVVRHTLDMLTQQNDFYDYIVLLQPTSPLRNEVNIDEAAELLICKSANGIVGVTEVEHPVEWTNTLPVDRCMEGFFPKEYRNIRSQDIPLRYRINGSIYLNKIQSVLDEKALILNENSYAYIMPRSASVDIDSEFDFNIANCIFQTRD